VTRLVAILGFSDGSTEDLHPVCALRLRRGEEEARPNDVVLFSGWARAGCAGAEADLMAASWRGAARTRLVDRGARTTLGNALSAARAARRIDADEVVLVTSGWHARRAAALVRAALAGTGVRVRIARASGDGVPVRSALREGAAWLLVPALALVAARNR
jgi:uncharacterized SAM-binding protein YcdF (DUF218 family)